MFVKEAFHHHLVGCAAAAFLRRNGADVTRIRKMFRTDMPEYYAKAKSVAAAEIFEGTHDFKGFSTKKKMKKSTVRTITDIQIKRVGDEVRFKYKGNGFLYHMVRILSGTLIEVGLGIRNAEDIPSIIEAKDRSKAGHLIPGKGLVLMEVTYDN